MLFFINFFLFFLPAYAQTNQELDQLLIKNCSVHSEKEQCSAKLGEIRQGLKLEALIAKAPSLPIDSQIQTILIKDPSSFVSDYYCLAVYNEIISIKEVAPQIFPYIVYGFSFSSESLLKYKAWLHSAPAKGCKEALASLKLVPTELQSTKKMNILLNPQSFLEAGIEENFVELAIQNYNHERLHFVFKEKQAQRKTEKLWRTLTSGEQEQFKKEHASYNFSNKNILYREFFSYSFEKAPLKAYAFLEDKKLYNFERLKKETCGWCQYGNDERLRFWQTMSDLPPSELLKKIESEKIKVLILASGRKSSTKFFSWGQLRLDQGQLSQISHLEGAMGKTLCKGERPESKEELAIILASDSPYSTLVHEYIHALQIKSDSSWCTLSKRLWNEEATTSFETRQIRDHEWDVRLLLWSLINSKQFNIEDRLLIAEGTLREGKARKDFDASATRFLHENKVEAYLNQKVIEYKNAVK